MIDFSLGMDGLNGTDFGGLIRCVVHREMSV